ncbi:MAG: type I-C CRISPR-associated protein Cas5c [Acutalibacteraceae bacterium]
MSYGFKILVSGDYACFTRPEMKVERVSYDVPTPGALCGMLKSVYWKPAIRYVIDKIVVFNPINFISIKKNEVNVKASYDKVKKQMKGKKSDVCIYSSEKRHQRASMVLKNVKYGIEFHFELTGLQDENESDGEKKHYNIIKRRLEKGQFYKAPCLGLREFAVNELELVDKFDLSDISNDISKSDDVDLGYMLYEMKFKDEGKPEDNDWENPKFSDSADAVYYRPHMINGIIDVQKYKEVLKC